MSDDPMTEAVLSALFRELEMAREMYRNMGACNTAGKTAEERMAQSRAYEEATQRWLRAERAWSAAMKRGEGGK